MKEALEFAKKYHKISALDERIIFHSKQTVLRHENETWTKRDNSDDFDITMGSFDGAEAAELVGCYVLNLLNNKIGNAVSFGLYRDDGLGVSYGSPKEVESYKKEICSVFESIGLKITIETNKKIVDFLDITLNLNTGKYQPFLKPGNKPIYINTGSNHPPSVLRAVPDGINTRLSNISSDEETFKKATPIYQRALHDSGFSYKLKYKPSTRNRNKKRKRKRNVLWFNPPYDRQVKTNVGKRFIAIVKESFDEDNPLKKIFNKNTVKLSYSCLPNIKRQIDNHNKRQLKKPVKEPDEEHTEEEEKKEEKRTCNCRKRKECPLDGECLKSDIVYQATVTEKRKKKEDKISTYIGLTSTTFKARLANHKQSFKNPKLRNATELSKLIWELKTKEEKNDYTISWKLISSAPAYNNISKKCQLCLEEMYFIVCHPSKASLNQRGGLISKCMHSRKFLLSRFPT